VYTRNPTIFVTLCRPYYSTIYYYLYYAHYTGVYINTRYVCFIITVDWRSADSETLRAFRACAVAACRYIIIIKMYAHVIRYLLPIYTYIHIYIYIYIIHVHNICSCIYIISLNLSLTYCILYIIYTWLYIFFKTSSSIYDDVRVCIIVMNTDNMHSGSGHEILDYIIYYYY
jgi:hypothetical protein